MTSPAQTTSPRCSISMIVIVHRMADQADNGLYSLSSQLERELGARDFEIIVVEIASDDLLGEKRAISRGGQSRYIYVDERTGLANALNLGVSRSRGALVGLILDGSQLLTPRSVAHALAARGACDRPLVVVPQYVFSVSEDSSDDAAERRLIEELDWRSDPYALFGRARFGPANPNGFLCPLLGAACMFVPRSSFDAAEGADPSIDLPAALSLKLYTDLSRLPATRLFVTGGEGAFRQRHPLVMRDDVRRAERDVPSQLAHVGAALGPSFTAAHREPTLLGPVVGPAQRFLVESLNQVSFHVALSQKSAEPPWYSDPP